MSQLAPGFLNFGAIGSQPVPVTISATDSVQITGGVITLSNDVASPANGQAYMVSGGVRGWFFPTATTGSDSVKITGSNATLVNDVASPANGQAYMVSGGVRGWFFPTATTGSDSVNITGSNATLVNDVVTPVNGQYYGYSNNARGWFQPGFSNILDYGADPTGTNDNSTALSAALSSLPSAGGTVYFPHGVYKFTNPVSYSVASPCSVTLLGDGMDASKLTWTTAQASGALQFTLTGFYSSFHMRDLTLETQAASGGIGLALACTASTQFVQTSSDIFRCSIRGNGGYIGSTYWTYGIQLNSVNYINLDSVFFLGVTVGQSPLGRGLYMFGVAPGSGLIALVPNIDKCYFWYLFVGVEYGTYTQGMTIIQTNFLSCLYGVYGDVGVGQSQLTIMSTQFGTPFNSSAWCVYVNSVISPLTIVGCLLECNTGAGGINLQAGTTVTISNNVIETLGTVAGTAISLADSSYVIIADNLIVNVTTGLSISATCSTLSIHDNKILATTAISNSSSAATIVIHDNPGYNPVGGSVVTPGGSPWTYTAGPSPETHYISGGTLSSLIVGGVGIGYNPASLNTIQLGPNESYSVTYSVVPTVHKSVH